MNKKECREALYELVDAGVHPKVEMVKRVLNLDGQVCNGGFSQYVTNGYCSEEGFNLPEDLKTIGTETALTVANFINNILPLVEKKPSTGCFNNYWVNDPEDNFHDGDDEEVFDEDLDPNFQAVSQYDDPFYEINEQLLVDLYNFVTDQPIQKVDWVLNKKETTTSKPKCKLLGEDSNAFNIIGRVSDCLKKNGQRDMADQFRAEATKGDYDHLLATAMKYVEVV